MNHLQRLVSDISGYTPTETGARNDGYYECKSTHERWGFLLEYACIVYKNADAFTLADLVTAEHWLDIEHVFSEDERFHSFNRLGEVNNDNDN